MIGAILAAALSVPPAATYTYSIAAGAAKVAQSRVTVVHGASNTTVSEEADVNGEKLTTRAVFDGAQERSYDIAANGTPAASVAIEPQTVTIRAQGSVIPIAVPKTAFVVVDSGLGAAVAMLPAIIAQTHAATFTLVPTIRPRAIVFSVAAAAAGAKRPDGVPAGDRALALTAEGITQTIWFDPKTDVLDALEGPMTYLRTAAAPAQEPAAVPTAAPAATPPPPVFPSREITFVSKDGSTLAGTVSYPRGARTRLPAVVLVAGSGTHDRDETIGPNRPLREIADGLNGAGYAVLRYDKRFAGGSSSKTPPDAVGRGNYVDDVVAAARAAAADSRIDPNRIFLLGHSEGGELVMGAVLDGVKARGLALLAPLPLPYAQMLEDQRERGMMTQTALRTMLSMHFLQTWDGVDPRIEIKKIGVPILVVHGSKDINVTDAELAQLIAAAKESHRALTTVELAGDNHLFARLPDAQKSSGTEYYTAMPLDPRLIIALVRWLDAVPRG